jgi:hypothetical protein
MRIKRLGSVVPILTTLLCPRQKNFLWGNREASDLFWVIAHALWILLLLVSAATWAVAARCGRDGWVPRCVWGIRIALAAGVAMLAGAAAHGDAATCQQATKAYLARWAADACVPAMALLAGWIGDRLGDRIHWAEAPPRATVRSVLALAG